MSEAKTLPTYRPVSDILEREDGFHISMDMPGVDKEALAIDLNENELTVSAVTSYPPDPAAQEGRKYHHLEYGGGKYQRTFTISDGVDREKISANLHNGVLSLFIPKAENLKPRRIQVSAG